MSPGAALPTRAELEQALDDARSDLDAAREAYLETLNASMFAAYELARATERFAVASHRYYQDRTWAT